MYHLPDTLYEQEKMPRRAKRLFVDTFSQHHKLNAGDEEAAMQKARQALEERYVRVNDLQWIPRRAAYEIIRDDMSSDSDGPAASPPGDHARPNRDKRRVSYSSSDSSARSSDDQLISARGSDDQLISTRSSDDHLVGAGKARRPARKKKRIGKVVASQKFVGGGAQYSTDDDEDDY
ncbi:unknown [Orgyia pseudotsugata multiple nucleopolyhedrovirus]|uniref:Uncharacterized 19.9 kDa protein n=1 Tax=Orgyia pseudotsugata multicapsid polyhedrosis virus TaxID=262177 RepID=Y059_NPVOP|nr:hypothetical protein OpmnVgp062 [Orgyia pseudotsugata multiple nucleopolyhedrovirus]O10316.1 RecName: Full=Uncharacterized 19.9 kDa protein [Orgyia pseudotsugata multiple nucleopolyhedrovirus]pir/T10331/ hypothetical protein 62 - Orgyia pseudotsugata nuclear polyhedrosis virus [Orgyia pseudotsugata single capsid nuclopolyhedrovirus]AAC59061.1 unknown [Orgyia pseudotsugata multiple nucleopolyhedrovirus]